MQLTKFKQTNQAEIALTWSDGHNSRVATRTLRDACPCAGCKGETVLFRKYVPPEADIGTPGRYELKGATVVGNYALKLLWGDGHDIGMYTWEQLRSLCECEQCIAQKI